MEGHNESNDIHSFLSTHKKNTKFNKKTKYIHYLIKLKQNLRKNKIISKVTCRLCAVAIKV